MADRWLRAAILKSEPVDKLDAEAEVFYRRLMSVVDDFGRFDARPAILRVDCFPLRVDRVSVPDVTRWLRACSDAGLVDLYEVDGKPYGVFRKLGKPRAAFSKFPGPPANSSPELLRSTIPNSSPEPSCAVANICAQMSADVGGCSQMSADVGVGKHLPRITNDDVRSTMCEHADARAQAAPVVPQSAPITPPAEPTGGNPPRPNGDIATLAEREAARAAFGRWSGKSRSCGIKETENEHTVIHELLAELAQEPPVLRGGKESIPAFKLVPLAADQMREEGANFKEIHYACKCVRNRIRDWIREGIPGPSTPRSRERPKSAAPKPSPREVKVYGEM